MYSKDQLEAKLKGQAKNAMFERDFMLAFNKHINLKKENASKTYAELTDWQQYRLKPVF